MVNNISVSILREQFIANVKRIQLNYSKLLVVKTQLEKNWQNFMQNLWRSAVKYIIIFIVAKFSNVLHLYFILSCFPNVFSQNYHSFSTFLLSYSLDLDLDQCYRSSTFLFDNFYSYSVNLEIPLLRQSHDFCVTKLDHSIFQVKFFSYLHK